MIKKFFTKPSAPELAQTELDEARRQLLLAQTAAEYAQHQVALLQGVIGRLDTYLVPVAPETLPRA